MSNKKISNEQAIDEAVGQATAESMKFIEKHKKSLLGGTIAVVAVALAIFAYRKFYIEPVSREAMDQTFVAEQYFKIDSFALALRGDGNSLGFEEIINEYGSKGGEAVYLYAGISALKLKEYEKAIEYLKQYRSDSHITNAMALCNIGDCYSFLEDYDSAASYYLKAADTDKDTNTAKYLLKAALNYEATGNYDKALVQYNTIKDKYSASMYDIDKYIERAKMRSEQK